MTTMRYTVVVILALAFLAAFLAMPAFADGLNPIEQDALTTPSIQRGLLGTGSDRLDRARAETYRGALATSRFRLDRSGQRSNRAVQERRWELGVEQSRIERGLLNVDRLRSTYP